MKGLRRSSRQGRQQEAELDITSFMNLMIVLVPVLLLSLVFSQVRILNLQLPISSGENQTDSPEQKQLELIINQDAMVLNYPSGVLLKSFTVEQSSVQKTAVRQTSDQQIAPYQYDFQGLSQYLQDLKLTFQQKEIEKKDIVLLLGEDVDYQTIVTAMDTVRSFKTVVAASVVDAELFPDISLGDAPPVTVKTQLSAVTGG
ncbi:biopolymer transporter ExbD [Endozoicomonas sp. G2_1]|uniref:biopolymer transporter ExbD n=1 Tax=Endozoicomonas sp. G2_1 TaxID=2821091 RepID=UPI001ADD00F4|nr:biopolymer transporter ExbD [Endozoicomonas sp. G2_1]MBO9488839.1 biopolymer transporter ExbD [Endozoicomonas sp. G2_1]